MDKASEVYEEKSAQVKEFVHDSKEKVMEQTRDAYKQSKENVKEFVQDSKEKAKEITSGSNGIFGYFKDYLNRYWSCFN